MMNEINAGGKEGRLHWFIIYALLFLPLMAWGGRSEVKPAVWSPHSRPSCLMNMGPTGVQAWIRGYQFQVEMVDSGSPADGVLEPGDVVVGAGGVVFFRRVGFADGAWSCDWRGGSGGWAFEACGNA